MTEDQKNLINKWPELLKGLSDDIRIQDFVGYLVEALRAEEQEKLEEFKGTLRANLEMLEEIFNSSTP